MTRFVVDADVVLDLAAAELRVPPEHELLAPTLLRSQTLSRLHQAVRGGRLGEAEALERLERVGRIKIRLLGDAVLRRNAWRIAEQLGWEETYTAEYIALTKLQADAFVTLDRKLVRAVKGIVATATIDDMLR
jgi:predicted nucleic acid-binding protein